ncbi:glycoside hydrolase family 31 protein [Stigmatella sp. ncwal1]|uniref:Glycoside hydrolase family 31 protein n=1 Tax=Stigmatella ashevillensis TaxID=2995309 RepID=A0ABT5DB14_9BACT|nr:TIM-barrel domain-containing protein [Stigmatella ashevillena]MDC0710857.1 glycoside hydrolase family 31 protein [Stigmatella ashevillena]
MRKPKPGQRLTRLLALIAGVGCGGARDDAEFLPVQEGGPATTAQTRSSLALSGGAGPYTFGANVGSSMCLDVDKGSPDPRTNIQVWNCTGGEPQKFWVENQGDGLVRLVNTGTNKCVDIDNAGTADRTNIQLFPCNGTNAQKFRIEDGGNGKVRFVSPLSNKCLDVAGAVAPRDTVTDVQLFTCNGTNAQLWTPNSLASGARNVTGVTSGADSVTISMSSGDQLKVRMVKPEIAWIDFLPGGASSPKTLVVDPAKTWATGTGVSVNTGSDPITLTTSKMVVKISRTPCRVSISDTAGNVLISEQAAEGFYGNGVNFNHAAGEPFYGIGGYHVLANSDAGLRRDSGGHVTASEQGHAGAPFAFTLKYGLLFDSASGDFLIDSSRLEFSNTSKKDVDLYFIVGEPKAFMQAVTEISGRPPMFPKWAMGFINTEWGADKAEVTNIINTYRSKAIPIDSFIFDFDWKAWGEDNYGEWRWNSVNGPGNYSQVAKFPDGASGGFAATMAAQGIKLGGITKPRILLKNSSGGTTAAAQWAFDHGCFFKQQGDDYVDYFSGRQCKDVNFALTDCRNWFWSHFKDSYDAGIVAWWNDEADNLGPWDDNFQFLNMQRGAYEWQRAYSGKRVWSINRNQFLGSQRYGYALWSGDTWNFDSAGKYIGWKTMAEQRERLLASVNAGAVKWGMDTGAHNGTPTNENYARYMQFSAMVPVHRVHGYLNQQRQPWVYGPIAEAAAKNALYLRYRLFPYIYAYERTAYETGLGLVWPLFYEFLGDTNIRNTFDSWMFGNSLLASPVVEEGQSTKTLYLPSGTWYDFTRGTAYVGPQWIRYSLNTSSWEDLPLFIRKGAIIPMQESQNWIGERAIRKVYLEVFPDTAQSRFTYYDDDGETFQYEASAYFKQAMTAQDTGASGFRFDIGAKTGNYTPPSLQYYIAKIHGKAAASVTVNGQAATRYTGKTALENAPGEGWATGTDVYGDVTYVKVSVGSARSIVATGTSAPDRTVYEAEEAILQGGGSINKDHANFSGSGFVDGYLKQGVATRFHVRVPTAGSYAVSLRYANATGSAKTLSVYVNGSKAVQTSLATLANWDTWAERAETLNLAAGDNIISYQYDASDSGNVNLDALSLAVASSSPAPVSPTYYRLKNRWTGDYLHIENLDRDGKVQYGAAPVGNWSSHWYMITDGGYTRIVNRWTGDVLHLEGLKGWAQYGRIPDFYASGQWTLEDIQGYKRFRNRWQPNAYVHIEDKLGYAQYKDNVPDVNASSQWSFEQVP